MEFCRIFLRFHWGIFLAAEAWRGIRNPRRKLFHPRGRCKETRRRARADAAPCPCTGVASRTRRGISCAVFLCSRRCQRDTIRRRARADIYHAFLLTGAAVQHKPCRACAVCQLEQLPVPTNRTSEKIPARRVLDCQRPFHARLLLPCCDRRGSRRFLFCNLIIGSRIFGSKAK